MKLIKKQPSKPGFYWRRIRSRFGSSKLQPVLILRDSDGNLRVSSGLRELNCKENGKPDFKKMFLLSDSHKDAEFSDEKIAFPDNYKDKNE